MKKIEIDFNDVIESLSEQVSMLSKECAYNVAVIRAKDKRIAELEDELKRYREKEIEEMNKNAE